MNNFEVFLDRLMINEGFYSNHPSDKGGETLFGISRKYHPNWEGWKLWDVLEPSGTCSSRLVFNYLHDEIKSFYEDNFWDAVHADNLPSGVDMFVADIAVNSGPSTAIKLLQKSVRARPDGVIGEKTMAKILSYPAIDILGYLADYRVHHYATQTSDAERKMFIRGWAKRTREMYLFCRGYTC